jgi:hypothetical protein
MHRCAQLLAPGGRILIEAEADDVDERLTTWLEHPDGRRGPGFAWARIGTSALVRTTAEAGLTVTGQWRSASRAFVCAVRAAERVTATDGTARAGSSPGAGSGRARPRAGG